MILKNSKWLMVWLSLVSIILLTLVILGLYDIKARYQETSRLLNEANRMVTTQTLARSMRMIRDEAGGVLEAFNKLVLTSDKLVPLIESIEKTGRGLGLDTSILSVAKTENTESGEPDVARIVIETQGPWAGVLSFLRTVENLPHRVMIEESSFSRAEVGWRSRIVLALYLFD